jgi:hypothetical protein
MKSIFDYYKLSCKLRYVIVTYRVSSLLEVRSKLVKDVTEITFPLSGNFMTEVLRYSDLHLTLLLIV